jgi:hypothetical protein
VFDRRLVVGLACRVARRGLVLDCRSLGRWNSIVFVLGMVVILWVILMDSLASLLVDAA